MNLKIVASVLIVIALVISSCEDKDEKTVPPEIKLEQKDATFLVKVGRTLTIEPEYKNAQNAVFAWKLDGKIISKEPVLKFQQDKAGPVYVSLEVINSAGTAYKEIKINVANLVIPSISLLVPQGGYTIPKDGELDLKPTVEGGDMEISYKWTLGDKELSTEKDYVFSASETGKYVLKFSAVNEDGEDTADIPVNVCNPEDMPFSWFFEKDEYNLSKGRKIQINIFNIENDMGADYIWEIDGEEQQNSKETSFVFTGTEEGVYLLKVKMINEYVQQTKEIRINVCLEEGTYKRGASSASLVSWNKVYEFLPAPGQFVNEGYVANTMEEAIEYAENRLRGEMYVSLGGYGGYIVAGFDHSVENDGSYNIQIKGNSFKGSSEPGIVWVMQDENGDGLPNDTWYQLKGSEYDNPETIKNYAITYYKPKAPGMPVQWTDNQGCSGTIDYLGGFHRQDYYYPEWVQTPTYVLTGTRLAPKTEEVSPGYWSNGEYEWGYVDNFSPIDRLTDDDNYSAGVNGNHFKISNAVRFDGEPANLKYIDFVKIQTGVNVKAGWLGENSTEVFSINDFNIIKAQSNTNQN